MRKKDLDRKCLLILWYIFVRLGNIKGHDKGIAPDLLRNFAWSTACLYHVRFGKFPYGDWHGGEVLHSPFPHRKNNVRK